MLDGLFSAIGGYASARETNRANAEIAARTNQQNQANARNKWRSKKGCQIQKFNDEKLT